MNKLVYYIWLVIQIIIASNLVIPCLLYLLYRGISIGRRKKDGSLTDEEGDYAIIVTAYEQTDMLKTVVPSLLSLNYQRYIVYVVADKCDISRLNFDDERVVLLRPETVLASNTRSHFYAIDRFRRPHNRLTIIDSDNLVDPEYLNELEVYFHKGFEAVQGVRKAKNLDGTYACLDAARDFYYHFYDGKILFNLGSSATLAGSGMAFSTDLYKTCLGHLDIVGAGFDKVLQYEIVKRNKRIAYTDKAVVYDQKTVHADQLVNQRARWINTWFRYFAFGFDLLIRGIARLSWNQTLFGLILLRPPLFLFLLFSVLCAGINLIINPAAALLWFSGLLIFIIGFFIALGSSAVDVRVYRSLANIPIFMFYQVISLVKSRRANKISVATRHYEQQRQEEDV